jgi:hypothetical protein
MLLIDHVLGLRFGLGCHQRSPGPTSLCKKKWMTYDKHNNVVWTHVDFCKSLAFAVFVKIRELDFPVTCQKFSPQKCKHSLMMTATCFIRPDLKMVDSTV